MKDRLRMVTAEALLGSGQSRGNGGNVKGKAVVGEVRCQVCVGGAGGEEA